MTNDADDFALVRGSGNVFTDLGLPNPQIEQVRAMLAAEISKAITAQGWGVREAARETGIPAADLSRIRRADIGRFTIDRLMLFLDKLHHDVAIRVTVQPRATAQHPDDTPR